MGLNTDLALEAYDESRKIQDFDGAKLTKNYDSKAELSVTVLDITSQSAAERLGKPEGKYITLESDAPFYEYSPLFSERCRVVAKAIGDVCEKGAAMFVGLGNRRITADSLGPLVSDRIFATRHIKRLAEEIDCGELEEASVIAAGVTAQTGLESAEIVAAVCGKVKPRQVIVCDALACEEPCRMGRTIQICSAGISPGSGVENARQELSRRTLGVPVAAIGIPTVSRLLSGKEGFGDLLVTPKPIDRLVLHGSELIAAAVNMYLHPTLSHEEALSLTL